MELSGILGGSVTFPLGIPAAEHFENAGWMVNTNSLLTVAAGQPPNVVLIDKKNYRGCMRILDESYSPQITHLRMEDTGQYTADINTDKVYSKCGANETPVEARTRPAQEAPLGDQGLQGPSVCADFLVRLLLLLLVPVPAAPPHPSPAFLFLLYSPFPLVLCRYLPPSRLLPHCSSPFPEHTQTWSIRNPVFSWHVGFLHPPQHFIVHSSSPGPTLISSPHNSRVIFTPTELVRQNSHPAGHAGISTAVFLLHQEEKWKEQKCSWNKTV
ncbi:unnamed protein product [Caretta caretta]